MREDYINKKTRCHTLDTETIIQNLETNAREGLSEAEAKTRLERFGPNALPEKEKTSMLIRFLKHFDDILIYVLFFAGLVTFVLGHYVDTVVIVIVAVINAIIGFVQENKAEKALEDIRNMLPSMAMLLRGGQRVQVAAEDITLGDIVLLNPGDKIPADMRIIRSDNLRIEESPLTGESVPSEKNTQPIELDAMLGDRTNMAFSGTTVSAGTGAGVVTAIGQETEIGKINQLMSEVETLTTPLLEQTDKLGKTVSFVIIAVAVVVYLFGHFFRDYSQGELLLSVIGLAVAAIPEGLPAIMSIVLAIGVQKMAERKAIIRNLPSVETLGAVSVICSDKTGTLTQNEMTVKKVIVKDDFFEVSGTGYQPEGDITRNGERLDICGQHALHELLHCFYVCNEAQVGEDEHGHWKVKGDPTEGALVTLFKKAKLEEAEPHRLSTIPFDSEYKYMATLVECPNNNIIYIKGAPDRLLDMASKEQIGNDIKDLDRNWWEERISELAGGGHRMMGAAIKLVGTNIKGIGHDDIEGDVIFLGLAGIVDPPRPEVTEAVRLCKQAGITVKMITGDHADTAKAVGYEMGIGDGVKALQGRDLEEMSEAQLEEAAEQYDVFARTSPEHKLRLVNALQANGHISAMTGDGVNDAPALKKADVGIAMGIKGTEVTKDSAEIVLADDNFSTIVAAVEEGRRVYDNLKKTILFILPTNGAESFLIIASILFGTMLPLTPVQILWVNMVTSVTVSLALAFEKAETDIMQRPPRDPKVGLLDGYFLWRIGFVSVLIGGSTLFMNLQLLDQGYDHIMVQTVTLETIVICQLFHLFNNRSIKQSAFKQNLFSNKAIFVVMALLLVLQLSVTYLPFMNSIFGTVPLPLEAWKWPLLLGVIVFIVVEIEKFVMRKYWADKQQ